MIYADFESSPKESYTEKYQKHFAFSYGYKLVCGDDKFSKSCRIYLDKDAVVIR